MKWLDSPGRYPVMGRWSRALGLPERVPDAVGLALRTKDADGHTVDLLLTTSGSGRLTRRVPRLRGNATGGPYSTLLDYEVGDHQGVVSAFPVDGAAPVPATLHGFAQALSLGSVRFTIRVGGPRGNWRTLGVLTMREHTHPHAAVQPAFDPYANCLPLFHPTRCLANLRRAAYQGSREGRRAGPGALDIP